MKEDKYLNIKIVVSIIILTILTVSLLSGCGARKARVSAPPQKSSTGGRKKSPGSSKTHVSPKPGGLLMYDISSMPANSRVELSTPWEASPSGKYKATIEGRGKKAKEEGYAHIIIKDSKTGKLVKLTLENEKKLELTAKDIEWIDDGNLFVILGQPFGTVSMGGKIYKVNIVNGETALIKSVSSSEEYISVHKYPNGFTYKKYVYDDDNFIKGHIESGILK